jgi:protein-S-isoprenylcysteine O-methyltransferase Ste14
MSLLYKRRGEILALSALVLLILPPSPLYFWEILLLLLPAFALRVWARRHIGIHTRGSLLEAPRLSVSGPYARMRHPLYLSNALAGTALAGFHLGPGIAWAVFSFLMALFLSALARAEDRWLRKSLREEWLLWAAQVPAIGWARKFSAGKASGSVLSVLKEDVWTWCSWTAVFGVMLWEQGWRAG